MTIDNANLPARRPPRRGGGRGGRGGRRGGRGGQGGGAGGRGGRGGDEGPGGGAPGAGRRGQRTRFNNIGQRIEPERVQGVLNLDRNAHGAGADDDDDSDVDMVPHREAEGLRATGRRILRRDDGRSGSSSLFLPSKKLSLTSEEQQQMTSESGVALSMARKIKALDIGQQTYHEPVINEGDDSILVENTIILKAKRPATESGTLIIKDSRHKL